MTMDNGEIVRSFMAAKDRTKQVGILAQLNACTQDKIVQILKDGGVNYRLLPRARKKMEPSIKEEGFTTAEPKATVNETPVASDPLEDKLRKEIHDMINTYVDENWNLDEEVKKIDDKKRINNARIEMLIRVLKLIDGERSAEDEQSG